MANDNIDEKLLLNQSEQEQAAGGLREAHGQEMLEAATGAEGARSPGYTFAQQQKTAQNAQANVATAEGAGSALGAKINPLSKILQKADLSFFTPWFPLALFWINVHVFLNISLDNKIFCKLGDEWISVLGEAGAKKAGLGEKMALVFFDVLVAAAAAIFLFLIISIVNSPLVKAGLGAANWWNSTMNFFGLDIYKLPF